VIKLLLCELAGMYILTDTRSNEGVRLWCLSSQICQG